MSTRILFDFEPAALVELCHDTSGARIELLEVTGLRQRDVDELLRELQRDLAASFAARPAYRRIVVWSDAAWLAEHDAEEYATVRAWLEEGLRDLQDPWRLPMTGQVGGAVLQGGLPEPLLAWRTGERRDLDYEAERPPERRAERRR